MSRTPAAFAACLLLALGASLPARADGPTRPATAAERQFHARMMAACAKALPPAPAGWAEVVRDTPPPPDRVSTGTDDSGVVVECSVEYEARDRQQRHDALVARMAGQRGSVPRQADGAAAGTDAQLKRMEALGAQMAAAAARNDMAAVQRLQGEMERVSAAMGRAQNADAAASDLPYAEKRRALADTTARIVVTLNEHQTASQALARAASPAPLKGATQAERVPRPEEPDLFEREGESLYLLGAWRKQGEAWFHAPARAATTTLHSAKVSITAEDRRAEAIARTMDTSDLLAVLRR